uniref:Uncharacterized protein n=1 Tax=Anguilla anguilla TaxID=7936 RepID=A0A0E9UHI6_ANGAN
MWKTQACEKCFPVAVRTSHQKKNPKYYEIQPLRSVFIKAAVSVISYSQCEGGIHSV